jgi:hypothetical protein
MRLLIIGCSKSKAPHPGRLPARERYCGTCWKVVHRALRDCPTLDQALAILVISAEFGAIDSQHSIPTNERRMSRLRADELREQIVAAIDARLMQQPFDDILICLGALYRPALIGANLAAAHATADGIGKQAQQLKWWLRHSAVPANPHRSGGKQQAGTWPRERGMGQIRDIPS